MKKKKNINKYAPPSHREEKNKSIDPLSLTVIIQNNQQETQYKNFDRFGTTIQIFIRSGGGM